MPRSFRISAAGWLVITVVVAALFLSLGALNPVQRLLSPVLTPVGRVSSNVVQWWSDQFANRASRRDLEVENDELRERLRAAELQRVVADKQITELKLLRNEADFLNRRALKGLPAHVVGRAQTSAQVLLIDVGSAQGIRKGAPVIAHDGILIGVITAVAAGTSEVRLLTAEGTDIAVRVERQDGLSGVLVGERGVGMQLTLVPKGEALQAQQLVITADVDPRIPSNLLIGSIANVQEAPGALFQNASVIPAVPYDQLSVLTILQ